ncbi:aminotransferase [Acinetobacter baumannii]|uniref:aminotransferase n=1 Tax=Acinetobacter baumannii TaxID=470 RepID=UPI00223B3D6F|nr:aminotransferase [Acinetobacter baumannii]MCT2429725.1 aminotransferase [Acinetobacter baumannii]MCT2461708.1 aminotransferase [Acinetobacter baumannii]MCT2465554.1 aminotransferase [Acinetobacter baumannii]MCT2468766.1 aminotransferase [Acinetobacter baumannii]MCT2472909.1 aminotransferase [Acinetobacter baumannii]
MNQITDISQQKVDWHEFCNFTFEIQCHLSQIGAFALQASSVADHENHDSARKSAQSISKSAQYLLTKIFTILEILEPIFKHDLLNKFSNSMTDVSVAFDAVSETDMTAKYQCEFFYGMFHVIKELEKELDAVEIEAEQQFKGKING